MQIAISAQSPVREALDVCAAAMVRKAGEYGAAGGTGEAGEAAVLTHVTLAPDEAVRLPRGVHHVRAVRGAAHLTQAGRDLILWPGDPEVTLAADAREERRFGPVVAGPLGGEETVLEFSATDAEEGARWLKALFANETGWRRKTRFWRR